MDLPTKLKRTREHWEHSDVQSLADANLRTLEINAIVASLRRYRVGNLHATLADFGCGDGFDTQAFSEYAATTTGFDYSNEMMSRAAARQSGRLRFEQVDLIRDGVPGNYHVAVTKRFLINLGDWSIQSQCIQRIADAVVPGGILMMLECFEQGLESLNCHRHRVSLPSIVTPYHNAYLDFEETMASLRPEFEVLDTVDFSTYFYLTRCLSPKIAHDKAYELDETMRLVAESDDFLQGARIGPQALVCLRKN